MASAQCRHLGEIREVTPSAEGCEDCLKMGDTWVHLRLCRSCGHVGCCDSSKNRHATKHFRSSGHPSCAIRRFASEITGGSRVAKYRQRFTEALNLGRRETAILCVLMLRGPQTPGELRGRTERMHRFEELSDVQSTLQRLMQRDPPLVMVLPRQPGTKEARYAHLLSGEVTEVVPSLAETRSNPLEAEVAALRQEVAELRTQVERLLRLVE